MSSRKKTKPRTKTPSGGKKGKPLRKLLNRIGLLAVVAFVAFCLIVIFTTPSSQPPSGPKLPQRTGTAWEYDERFDAYWDPRPGHEHWHEGRPPADADR